ncbi:3-deoxy-D-manno-oct-2-ulosonic acid transferase [Legionella busanensis]|uniref:3-deoxy-D-manno-octulosonic acid transferase n=1 Tax=Legionella busanensis TaxID=190655 RepID=A0A378JLP9_9GAMM|nr:lipid IV(A) 3-deoxy-D-manno-octulosonic acid transferase [Legionella busanensis]STX52007.1 3-deoxy-D-manno-oct-2-ulosonic acid transferase [Legionella busanensis]
MRQIYSFLFYCLSPYLLFRLWWKGRKLPAYRQRINERFGYGGKTKNHYDVWLHAVSLGEVIAAIPLIEALLQENLKLLITTMTPTGAEKVQVHFKNRLTHRYIPYDLPQALRRFFKFHKPRLGIIMETELWPNLITIAAKESIPLLLLNARLSKKSYNGYKKIKYLVKPLLNKFHLILAQSAEDAAYFKQLGAKENKVQVGGNIKFDLQMPLPNRQLLQFDKYLGENRIRIIVASTHEGEEQLVLNRLNQLKAHIPNVLLLIAPRHPERFQKVYQLACKMGYKTGLRSQITHEISDEDIIILDSIGELLTFYKLSHYAFIGGSLVPIGGHNVLEPIAMQIPVISGKYTHNFRAICKALEEANAIILIDNADELVSKLIELHKHQDKRQSLVENATQILNKNKGTVSRYLHQINNLL